MQYEFLKQFSKRMKHVGMYALLLQNSLAKQTWKQYGFMKTDEQINMIFAVMLYIMEQSLREESCTMDDIGAYIDNLNTNYFQSSFYKMWSRLRIKKRETLNIKISKSVKFFGYR